MCERLHPVKEDTQWDSGKLFEFELFGHLCSASECLFLGNKQTKKKNYISIYSYRYIGK